MEGDPIAAQLIRDYGVLTSGGVDGIYFVKFPIRRRYGATAERPVMGKEKFEAGDDVTVSVSFLRTFLLRKRCSEAAFLSGS